MQASKEELLNVVEGILFVSGQGVEIKDIAEKLEVDQKKIEKVIEELKEKHKDDGFNIITYKKSVQMCSNPKYAEDIATVLNPIREKQLTKAALETLAIVAYKQPITRLDIEQVRGVNSDYALQVLINFKLVEVVGRKDAVGKPLLFGTTDEFLKRFDLQNIDDLPDYEELLNRIKILHEPVTDALYKSTEIIPEEDLPDSKAKTQKVEENNSMDTKEQDGEAKVISEDTEVASDSNSNLETAKELIEEGQIIGEENSEYDESENEVEDFIKEENNILDSLGDTENDTDDLQDFFDKDSDLL